MPTLDRMGVEITESSYVLIPMGGGELRLARPVLSAYARYPKTRTIGGRSLSYYNGRYDKEPFLVRHAAKSGKVYSKLVNPSSVVVVKPNPEDVAALQYQEDSGIISMFAIKTNKGWWPSNSCPSLYRRARSAKGRITMQRSYFDDDSNPRVVEVELVEKETSN